MTRKGHNIGGLLDPGIAVSERVRMYTQLRTGFFLPSDMYCGEQSCAFEARGRQTTWYKQDHCLRASSLHSNADDLRPPCRCLALCLPPSLSSSSSPFPSSRPGTSTPRYRTSPSPRRRPMPLPPQRSPPPPFDRQLPTRSPSLLMLRRHHGTRRSHGRSPAPRLRSSQEGCRSRENKRAGS